MASFYTTALACLQETDVDQKCSQTRQAWQLCQADALPLTSEPLTSEPLDAVLHNPGRPARPELVAPRQLSRRRLGTLEGRAALIHALAHIEFNAINLAWDAVYRFRGMPDAYYRDWIKVAAEEAYHFSLLRDHLRSLNYDYGDFPAHDGLWEMAQKTAQDVMARMALVPRCLEARGLDATPALRDKLLASGDTAAAAILDVILRDEIGHVAIGDYWFKYCCRQRQLEPESQYRLLLKRYYPGQVSGPLHVVARLQAGFSQAEIDYLIAAGAAV